MEITGYCVWCKGDDNPDLYRVAIEFIEVSSENEVLIDEVVRRYKREEQAVEK